MYTMNMNKISQIFEKSILFLLTFFALIALYGSVIYRLHQFDFWGLFFLFILVFLSFIIILNLGKKSNEWRFSYCFDYQEKRKYKTKKLDFFLTLFYLPSAAYFLFTVSKSGTTSSITSPWEVVPVQIFLLFSALNLIVLFLLRKGANAKIFLLSIHYFLTFSIIVFVYKLGYGFDSFVHLASLEHIDRFFEINPKPLYYLGFYSIIIFLKNFLFIPIEASNHFLVPVMAAVFIPYFLLRFSLQWFKETTFLLAKCFVLLALPFSFFTHSLPQNLAFLFLLLLILSTLSAKTKLDHALLFLLALSTLAIHPISGIPATFFVLFFLLKKYKSNFFPRLVLLFFLVLNSLALPVLFLFLNRQLSNSLSFDIEKVFSLDLNLALLNQENAILNSVYFWNNYSALFFFCLVIFGLVIFFKHRKKLKKFEPLFYFFLTSFLAYLLTQMISFSYLIEYEQDNFSKRLLINSLFFLLPFLMFAVHKLFLRFQKQNVYSKLIIALFLAVIISANFYLSYPRFDNYHNSHGFSVSTSDIEATKWIEANASSDYVVLASQQVSAASLKASGFKKYYQSEQGEIFYYPIPTSGKLYQIYLDMVYDKPSKENAEKAKSLTGAKEVYFVLNKYWWAFDKLEDEARLESKEEKIIGDGEVIIFKY